MTDYQDIEQKVYESADFARKGHSATIEDAFIVECGEEPYVIMLVRHSRLDGTFLGYRYAMYDVLRDSVVDSSQPAYGRLAASLPALDGLGLEGGGLGFFDKLHLDETMVGLIEEMVGGKALTSDIRRRYIAYLRQRGAMESPSFGALYAGMACMVRQPEEE